MANGSGGAGAGAGGGGMLAGLSDALSGIGKFIEKNPGEASTILGTFGQAISPEGSWQSTLGGASAGMGSNMAQRSFLQQLLGPDEEELSDEELLRLGRGRGTSALGDKRSPAEYYGMSEGSSLSGALKI